MHLTWRFLGGEVPSLEPHLLPEGAAEVAQNVRLGTGGLRPLRNPAFVMALAKAGAKKTIYRYGQSNNSDTQHWFHWTSDVDVCRGPVADDTQERVYFTGDGDYLLATDKTMATSGGLLPSSAYRVGLPRPSAPSVQVAGTPDEDATAVKIVAAYQFLNSWNEPGPVSEVSQIIDYYPGQTLTVSAMDGAPSGAYNTPYKRIYVAATDSEGSAALRFWDEVAVGVSSTSGVVDFAALGEAPYTPDMVQPPDNLFGVMLHPNRFLVGFTTRRICRSEANRPYGWPVEYRDPVGDDIVGGAILGQSIVVCTRGKTYLATGQDPLNQAIIDLAGYQPCVAKRSIRALPFGVVYASPDGLVLVASSGPLVVISEQHFTREQWQALKPDSMHAVVHDNRYLVWYDTGQTGGKGGLIFEFEPTGAIRSITRTNIHVLAAYADNRRDDLFVSLDDGNLYKWDAGAAATMKWRAPEVRAPRPQAVGAAKVIADEYPVTFRWYERRIDENKKEVTTQIDVVTVQDAEPFTLSGDERRARFFWEIESTHPVTQVEVASSIFDMRR